MTDTRELLEQIREKQRENDIKHNERKKQLTAKARKLTAKLNEEERKKRTHRLIEIGGSVESICGLSIEKEDLPRLIAFLRYQEKAGFYFSKTMGYDHIADSEGTVVYKKVEGGVEK